MIYSLLVLSSPGTGCSSRTAAQFAHAAVQRGHSVARVFFLDEGVNCGTLGAIFPQDEEQPVEEWMALAELHSTELILCISSALRRGVVDAAEAKRHDLDAITIHPAFEIAGLGQLIDAAADSDRLVTFGG